MAWSSAGSNGNSRAGKCRPMMVRALLLAWLATPLAAQTPTIARVGWLQGCWALATPQQRVVEEQWMAPRGRSMVGMGRTLRGDSLMEFEVVVIREGAGTLVYEAHPSGQPPDSFTAIAITDTGVVFENAAHDFPQRVGYRRIGRDSLIGYIEGTLGGRARHIEFPYARARCAGESSSAPPRRGEGPLTQAERDALLRELETHRADWRARRITDYRLEVSVGCFCPWRSTPGIIEVRRGKITQLRDSAGKGMGPVREPWSLYSVEGLFDAVEQAVTRSDMVQVAYDDCYGFPTAISGVGKLGLPDNWFWVKARRLTPLR